MVAMLKRLKRLKRLGTEHDRKQRFHKGVGGVDGRGSD